MPDNFKTLNSKLAEPRIANTITRERLLALMDQSPGKRLTTVTAGAGFGKTTLVAQAKARWRADAVWYRLDESDRDLVTFIRYLVSGIGRFYPGFGTATARLLNKTLDPGVETNAFLTVFLDEIDDALKNDCTIILDDYHLVNDSREINSVIEHFLRDVSPLFHLIIISRGEPPLPISRLRSSRDLVEITENDLAFTDLEIEQLCSELFGLALDRSSISGIQNKLGGWVSGLILFCHSLRGKVPAEIEQSLLHLKGPRGAIFSYLEENIYRKLSPEQRDFALRTSIFSRISSSFCDNILKVATSRDMLGYFEQNHLFTSSAQEEGRSDPWYFYHQLFRDFLLTELENKFDPPAIMDLHRNAALLFEQSGEEEEALSHFLQAGEHDRAGRLLKKAGRRLFSQGRFQLLNSYLDQIPAKVREDQPWTGFLQGRLLGLRGRRREALENYEKSLGLFLQRNDAEGIQNCLIESGLIHYLTGELRQAHETFQKLLEQENIDPMLQVEVLGYLIYNSAYLGDMDYANSCFDRALALISGIESEDLRCKCLSWIYYYYGFRYAFSGDYSRILELAEYIKSTLRGHEPTEYPLGFYLLLSMACCGLMQYSRAFEFAEEGLAIVREVTRKAGAGALGWHSPRSAPSGERAFPDTFASWLMLYSAKSAAELGKTAMAIDRAAETLRRFRAVGFRHGEALAYSVLYSAYMKSGSRETAERCARSGLDAIRGLLWPRVEGILKQDLAECLIEKGDPQRAFELLKDTWELAGEPAYHIRTNLLHARLHWRMNRSGDAVNRLADALEICRKEACDTLIVSEKSWIVPLLVEVLSRSGIGEFAAGILTRMGSDIRPHLKAIADRGSTVANGAASKLLKQILRAPAPDLNVRFFGKFRVLIDGMEIPASRWKSRKARIIFQYLAYHRPQGSLNKEVLMELLWPEGDPALTAGRFHVAMASLRRTIEPGMVRGDSSSCVLRTGDSYQIQLGARGWTDAERFSEEINKARRETDPEESIVHLLNAESFYEGDFLQEDPYSDWCSDLREKFRNDYLRLTERIIDHYERRGVYARCIEYAGKHIVHDRYAEDVYRSLMLFHWKTGDKANMVRTYNRCRDRITKELNCALSEETESLYSKLTSNNPDSPSLLIKN